MNNHKTDSAIRGNAIIIIWMWKYERQMQEQHQTQLFKHIVEAISKNKKHEWKLQQQAVTLA